MKKSEINIAIKKPRLSKDDKINISRRSAKSFILKISGVLGVPLEYLETTIEVRS